MQAMPTFFAGLGAKIWTALAAIGAVLALLGGVFLRGRAAGTQAARVKAAEDEQQARRAGDAAAADAERHGASELLKRGKF